MVLRALRVLLEEWLPLAYICGRKARACLWEGRAKGTGVMGKEVLMTCLLGLLQLRGDRAHTVEYVRTISIALIFWSKWHSRIPGACYSDESNESSLAQLGLWWEAHPEIRKPEQLSDLFLLLLESDPVRDLPTSSCSRSLLERTISGPGPALNLQDSHAPRSLRGVGRGTRTVSCAAHLASHAQLFPLHHRTTSRR